MVDRWAPDHGDFPVGTNGNKGDGVRQHLGHVTVQLPERREGLPMQYTISLAKALDKGREHCLVDMEQAARNINHSLGISPLTSNDLLALVVSLGLCIVWKRVSWKRVSEGKDGLGKRVNGKDGGARDIEVHK